MSVITCLAWVPRGYAKQSPVQQHVDLQALKETHIAEAQQDAEDMEDEEEHDIPVFAGVEYDPQLEGVEDEDKEDMQLEPDDSLLAVGVQNGDMSEIHVYCYVESTGALFVHHDVIVGAFPIAMQWLPYSPLTPTEPGNCLAVASFNPGIEIWDLDVLDAVEPVKTLGGYKDPSAHFSKKKRKAAKLRKGSHKEAVMNILASGSADSAVKIWDLVEGTHKLTHLHHSDKVQSVDWNPTEEKFLATGGFDKTVFIVSADNSGDKLQWRTNSDIETLRWNPTNPMTITVTNESGELALLDARNFSTAVQVVQAHSSQCCGSFSPKVPGLYATASTDKSVKLWDLRGAVHELAQKTMNVGELFCCEFYQDSTFTLAVGGTEGQVAIWDVEENEAVAAAFAR